MMGFDIIRPTLSVSVASCFFLSLIVGHISFHFFKGRKQAQQLRSFPSANSEGKLDNDWKSALFRASKQYPNTPFIINTGGRPRAILPNSTMDEIRKLPEDQVSLRKDLYEKMHGRWTDIATEHRVGIDAIRKELTSNVALLLPQMQDEVNYSLDREIGSCPSWTRVILFPHLLRLSAQSNGRFFVGPLCRDEAWSNLSIAFATDIMLSVKTIESWNKVFRPFLAPFLSPVRRLSEHKIKAARMLQPHVDAMLVERKNAAAAGKDAEGLHLINWMLHHVDTTKKVDVYDLAREELFIGSGSIHATALAVTNILLDLASHPEYIPELRAEFEAVLASEPGGKIRKTSLPKMRKLDSLLLECQRMNPVSLTSIHRRVTAKNGLLLSTGQTIPYDTSIGFLHAHAPFSSPPPNLAPPTGSAPLTSFYPFRFSELRKQPGEEGFHQFTQTGPENINFGHGPASCPGRWFASAELKTIILEILRRYDVSLGPNGEGESDAFPRPKSHVLPGSLQVMPDFTAAIHFKNVVGRG